MRILLAAIVLAVLGASALAQVRGLPENSAAPRKPDLTAGGGNSSVGATRPSLPESSKDRFAALDLDGDGKLSLAEAAGHEQIVVHFDKADRNRDGRLTQAEFDNLGKPVPKRRAKPTARTDRAAKGGAGTRSASRP